MTPLAIGDYGIIGDLHTAALVGRDGSIDWCCAPRFDSPSVFGALLDGVRGGRCRIAPVGRWTSEQRYLPATNILVTEFHAGDAGVAHLTDFMPAGPARGGRSEIHRRVNCPRGAVDIEILFEPSFEYGRCPAVVHHRPWGVLATGAGADAARIAMSRVLAWRLEGSRATATLRVAAGEEIWFVIGFDGDDDGARPEADSAERLEATTRWWDAWTARLRYAGPYRAEVERSALALKLCCYEPTGAIIAAPTTSLPETLGGDRNWDYRFAWLRDSAFVLFALERLGSDAETEGFLSFLQRIGRRADDGHLQIMYGVDGRRQLPESTLDHLAGYRDSRPVRIGNDAASQFQLDVYGEVLETVALVHRSREAAEGLWTLLVELVEWTAGHWGERDFSIWEARQEPKHYVFSKVMAWTALARGAQLARARGEVAAAARWETAAAAVHADVLANGWDAARATFVQAYGEPQLDASVLVIPLVRFLPRADPRVASTLAAIRRELGSACEELLYRYRSADGLAGQEGAFVVCSFWMVQNLAMVGAFAEAERLFRNLLRRCNHLGLLAEEIDPATGEQLGNFPQALSHAALINAACVLERLRGGEG